MIKYIDSVEQIQPSMLAGFFEGWLNPPSQEVHLEILKNSDIVLLAINDESGKAVGFITAISDDILCAHISALEVLPEFRNQGIGTQLVTRTLEKLKRVDGITLMCDEDLKSFYRRFDMSPQGGMNLRKYQI